MVRNSKILSEAVLMNSYPISVWEYSSHYDTGYEIQVGSILTNPLGLCFKPAYLDRYLIFKSTEWTYALGWR